MPTTDIDMKHCKGCTDRRICDDSFYPPLHVSGTIEHPIKTPDTFEEKKNMDNTWNDKLNKIKKECKISYPYKGEAMVGYFAGLDDMHTHVQSQIPIIIAEARAQERERIKKLLNKWGIADLDKLETLERII